MNSYTVSYLKKRFWPIKPEETKKILLICLFKGLVSSVYCIFINFKDVVNVTAYGAGAEVLTIIRGFLVLPFSILLVVVYSNLSNRFKPFTVFTTLMFFFGVSLLIYSFILRPYEQFFSPSVSAIKLLKIIGENNIHWVTVYKNWMHAFFYILAELWLQTAIFILFWEFVNRVCTLELSKRSYSIFIASGSFFNVVTGFCIYNFMKFFQGSYNSKIKILTIYMNLCIVLLIITYYSLNKRRGATSLFTDRTKLPFIKGLKYIFSSKYLLSIALIVTSLGLASNLLSITWKANLKSLYSIKEDYTNFMIKVNSLEHFIGFIFLIFISGITLRSKGWKVSASITPIAILITGSIFFLASKFRVYIEPLGYYLGISSLKFIVYLGALQVLITKVFRYAFYDMTKEMAYIPLDQESKMKGKAAIDTVCSRLGKSGSSYMHLFILWFANTSSVLNVTLYLIPVLVVIIALWLYAISNISKKIEAIN